jgi:hypothetical protein
MPKRKKTGYKLTKLQSKWIKILRARKAITKLALKAAFQAAFNKYGKDEFYSPVKPSGSHGELWYIPKGLTPQKTPNGKAYTPRRRLNPTRVARGLAPFLVLIGKPGVYSIEAHHITQAANSDNIFIPRYFHRGAEWKKLLHPCKETAIKSKDRKLHSDIRKEVMRKHFVARQLVF